MKQPGTGLEAPLRRLRHRLDKILDHPDLAVNELFTGWSPAVDVLEHKDKFIVKAELPGFKREAFDVSLSENKLVISGERRCEDEQKEGEFCRCERYYGKFRRSIPLPSGVDPAGIEAKYSDGILTVVLPKTEKARARQIEVEGPPESAEASANAVDI